MHLYNLKSHNEVFRITKFDADLNPEEGSSYLVHTGGCTCPQGHKDSCRHRKMLHYFLNDPKGTIRLDTAWFFDYDTRLWCDPTGEAGATAREGTMQVETDAEDKAIQAGSQSTHRHHEIAVDQDLTPPDPPLAGGAMSGGSVASPVPAPPAAFRRRV